NHHHATRYGPNAAGAVRQRMRARRQRQGAPRGELRKRRQPLVKRAGKKGGASAAAFEMPEHRLAEVDGRAETQLGAGHRVPDGSSGRGGGEHGRASVAVANRPERRNRVTGEGVECAARCLDDLTDALEIPIQDRTNLLSAARILRDEGRAHARKALSIGKQERSFKALCSMLFGGPASAGEQLAHHGRYESGKVERAGHAIPEPR